MAKNIEAVSPNLKNLAKQLARNIHEKKPLSHRPFDQCKDVKLESVKTIRI